MFTIVDRRAAGLWRTLSLAVAAMIATLAAASAQTPPLDAGPVVAPGATLERVFDGGFWT